MCLFSCDLDIQFLHQRFGDHLSGLRISDFPFSAIFASRLSFILFTRSLHARLLLLAHFILALRMSSLRILFYVAPVMYLKVLIFVVLV